MVPRSSGAMVAPTTPSWYFPYFLPGNAELRDYRLRRDHPALEERADGKMKQKS
jgi:hypothetical protein